MLTKLSKDNGISDRKKRKILRRYAIKDEVDIDVEKKKLKQKIQAKAQRIRRFEKRGKQFRQNRLFKSKPKVFYRELGKHQIVINDTPSTNSVEAFWKSILEDDRNHNGNADWISKHEEMYRNSPEQVSTEITKDEVTAAIRKTSNWKSPGVDNVPNFWLKNCETLHEDIARCYNKIAS